MCGSSRVRSRTIPEPLSLTVSLRGSQELINNCRVFKLTGLLDAFSEPVFRKVVGGWIDEGPHNIVLDLSGIDFIDSSGVGALVQITKQVQGYSGSLQVVGNARVTQTIKLVRLEKFLPLRSSLEEAVAAIPPDQNHQTDQSHQAESAQSDHPPTEASETPVSSTESDLV